MNVRKNILAETWRVRVIQNSSTKLIPCGVLDSKESIVFWGLNPEGKWGPHEYRGFEHAPSDLFNIVLSIYQIGHTGMARGKVDIKGTISDAIYIATNLITCDR